MDATVTATALRLFNDIRFGHSPPPLFETWTHFIRLPVELRLQIWLAFLRRHRMIELILWPADGEDGITYFDGLESQRYFTERNYLGRIISGRGYTFNIGGVRTATTTLNPLLWVNRESRHAALTLYYRVHLPYSDQTGRVLYLNPEHDVLCIVPSDRALPDRLLEYPRHTTVLADFLHDVKAFDPKDEGVIHLALADCYFRMFYDPPNPFSIMDLPPFTPEYLHEVSAASFAEILRNKLQSVFCPVVFRDKYRDMDIGMDRYEQYYFHTTFPIPRRGNSMGAFRWFESDPRPGVEFDLRQVAPRTYVPHYAQAWQVLHEVFGVEEHSRNHQLRLYMCAPFRWPKPGSPPEPEQDIGFEAPEDYDGWPLHKDPDFWFRKPKTSGHGGTADAEESEIMEKTDCTAVCMWLFLIDVFKERIDAERNVYDLSAQPPPGLISFEV